MKTSTVKFLKPALNSRMMSAGLAVIILCAFLSCDKERKREEIGVCGTITDCPPTSFTNQTGHMVYIEKLDQWGISFLPDCLVLNNIDTEYVGLIADFPLADAFKVENKPILFSAEINRSSVEPGLVSPVGGVEVYDLQVNSIELK